MAPPKVRYVIDLTCARPPVEPVGLELRRLAPGDRDGLAHLILDAYRGTIDYEGETLVESIEAIDEWLGDAPLLDHSIGGSIDGELVAAVLVMMLDGAPFVAIVMTAAAHKGGGYGRAVVEAALSGLRRAGHRLVVLYITDGNTPSERLFASVGAVAVDAT